MKKCIILLLALPLLSGCDYYGGDQGYSYMSPAVYASMNRPVQIPPPPPPSYYIAQQQQQSYAGDIQQVPAPPYYNAPQQTYQPPQYQPPQYQPPQYQVVTRSRIVCQSVVGNTLTGATMGAGLGAIIGAISGGHHSVMRGAWIGAASGGGLGALQQPQCHTVYYQEQVPY